jgi:hypothetical protein
LLSLVVAVPALGVMHTACGSAPDARVVNAPVASASGGASAGDAGVAPAEADEVVLLAAGDEPRRVLRYVFHPGTRERMKMEMRMTMAMGIGSKPAAPVTVPTMVTIMRLDPQRLTTAGNLLQTFAIESVDVAKDPAANPKVQQAVEKDLPKLVGLSGEAETTIRGQTLRAAVSVPPGVSQQVASMLEETQRSIREITVPLPVQPVGRGARWTSSAVVHMNKMNVTRTGSYTLSQIDGDRGTLDVEIALGAPAQDVDNGQGPHIRLESMTGNGRGSRRFDLQRLVPTSDLDLTIDVAMSVEAQGARQPVTLNTRMGVHVEPAQ